MSKHFFWGVFIVLDVLGDLFMFMVIFEKYLKINSGKIYYQFVFGTS